MAKSYDFSEFEGLYDEWEARFKSGAGEGEFSYRLGGPTSLYGSADMLISRATIGRLDSSATRREAWAETINRFQKAGSGLYRKRYTLHFPSHTAAYAVAALKLLGHEPRYPVRKAEELARNPERVARWLRRIPWSIIWPASHSVAGYPAILHMSGRGNDRFWETYFSWLDARAHPRTGFWSRGILQRLGLRPILAREELGGAFHMHFVYEARGRSWPLPERVVDAGLALQQANGFWDGEVSYCIDLDGLYCILRSSRNAGGYRAADAEAAVHRYLARAEETLNDRDFLFSRYDNSHRLTGALSAVAECALHYPGLVTTVRPWMQTLDRACFI